MGWGKGEGHVGDRWVLGWEPSIVAAARSLRSTD